MIDNKIEAKEILVKDLFDSKFLFKVPEYQRPFSWEADNFEQLFDDIRESLESNEQNYFLGTIILQINKINSDGSGLYDIVDGQQRLITLSILLAVMRDLTNNSQAKNTLQSKIYQEENEFEGTKEEVRISVRDREKEFFRKFVLEEQGTTKKPNNKNELSEPKQRILTAIELFRQKFYNNNNLNQKLLNSMIKYILNNCIFVYVKTGNFTSAFRLFSVLNDRGMPLSTSDLLKSINLSEVNESDRIRYQNIWEEIEEDLGKDELDKLIGFIRTILIKEYRRKNVVDEYKEIIFKKIMKPGRDFIEYLNEVKSIYQNKILDAILNSSQSELNVKYYNLMSIMREYIPFSDWMSVYISFALKYNDPNDLYKFLTIIERKYVVNWILGITATKRVVETNRILHVIEKSSNVSEIFNDEIFNLSTLKEETKEKLESSSFYKMKFSKYILLRLDLSLSENSNIAKSYKGIISVEHILPQNPKKDSEWMKLFDDNLRGKLTNKLGNLVLLSRRKNSYANNYDFKIKLKKYYFQGITDFELTKQIMNYNVWDAQAIEQRQADLINRLMNLYF